MPDLTRRDALKLALAALAVPKALSASDYGRAQLDARPERHDSQGPATPKPQPLGVGDDPRDGFFYVPATAPVKAPLIVVLHGAGGAGERIIQRFVDHADRTGSILVAPDSRGGTWNVTRSFGPDTEFVDHALRQIFEQYGVHAHRIAVSGFSDGASYALTLGLTNGDLFSHVMAFSAGFCALQTMSLMKPRVFLSHGTRDEILPIDKCGRTIAASLRRHGYRLTYREYDGPHSIAPEIVREAIDWFAG